MSKYFFWRRNPNILAMYSMTPHTSLVADFKNTGSSPNTKYTVRESPSTYLMYLYFININIS